jgi:two-component system cell cycle sensor histidine kinase/response regulator CckA
VLQPAVLDPNAVVGDVAKMLQRLVGDHIELVLRLDAGVGSVVAERSQVDQALVNLVLNARDAMPQGGRVTISTGEVAVMEDRDPLHSDPGLPLGRHVVIEVADTGVGMDATTRSRAFEPFFTTKPVGVGTGLGLSTVYGIVTQSGGAVALDSAPGVGTTVRLYLPRANAAPSTPATTAAVKAGNGETVLVVEDEDIVRRLARRVLEDAGYRVLEARNGKEALAVVDADTAAVDLVLTDLIMPELGGVELGRILASRPRPPRVLYMSAYTREHVVQHRLLDEDIMCVQKPFEVDTLAREVQRALSVGRS